MEASVGSSYSQTLIDSLTGLDVESFLSVIKHALNVRGDFVQPLVNLLVPDIIYPPSSILDDRRCEGTVTSYFPDKKFGYISCPTIQEEFEKDCIVLGSQLRDFSVGTTVNFAVCMKKNDGEPMAYDLHAANAAVKTGQPQAILNAATDDHFGGIMQKNNGRFGFIKQDNGEPDMFVMPFGCDGGLIPPDGVRVVYTITTDEKTGRPRAENVLFEDTSLSAPPVSRGISAMGNGYGAARPGRAKAIGNSLCVKWQSVSRGSESGMRSNVGMRSQPYTTPTNPNPNATPNAHSQNQFGQHFGGPQPFSQHQIGQDPSGAMQGELRSGTMFKDQGGFGFIKQDDDGTDMFIMPAACSAFGGALPAVGARLQYYVVNDSKTGRPRAEAACPLSEGQDSGAAQPFAQNQFGQDPRATMPGELRVGSMLRDQGAFGFIMQDGDEQDMFILPAACGAFGGVLPALGARVQYYVVTDAKTGRPRAEGACPAPEGQDFGAAQFFNQNPFSQDPSGAMPGALRLGTMFRDQGAFGFIKQDDDGPDMFIMPAACSAFGGVLPALGVRVQYDVVNDSKTGRPRAENACPVSI